MAALVVGKRQRLRQASILPHNVPFVLLGAGLLWFGWFGFNAGSALAASPHRRSRLRDDDARAGGDAGGLDVPRHDALGQADRVGCATAIVVGLVAVTPAAGFISPMNALALGGIAAVPSYFAIMLRAKTSLDDSLDVVAAHGVGGTVGALLTGVFAEKSLNGVVRRRALRQPRPGADPGRGGPRAPSSTAVSCSFVLLKLIGLVIPLRATTSEEAEGLDITAHGEEAYMHQWVVRADDRIVRQLVLAEQPVAQAGTRPTCSSARSSRC